MDVSTILKDQIAKYDTNDEFKEEVKLSTKLVVILFVSRTAPESMTLAPQFAKLQEGKTDSVHFGFVSAETNQDTCSEQSVSQYPSVVMFKNNN